MQTNIPLGSDVRSTSPWPRRCKSQSIFPTMAEKPIILLHTGLLQCLTLMMMMVMVRIVMVVVMVMVRIVMVVVVLCVHMLWHACNGQESVVFFH